MKLIRLNSYTPESFINIDSSHAAILIKNDCNFDYDVFLNSRKIEITHNNENEEIHEISVNSGYVRIYVNPQYSNSIKFNLTICDKNDKTELNEYKIKEIYDCEYTPSIIEFNNVNSKMINDNQSSYMLIRTNPKLSGNIKLVIDSNDNLYLDTFKINNELSQKNYRKRSVSVDSYYSNDVRNVFKSMTSNSLYSIPIDGDNYTNISNKQFIDTYNYGVKLNDDRLYSENFSMLAPLWINESLPDYFLILKVKNFDDNISEEPLQRFNYCIENGDIVKIFDIRKNSKLGTYLRNHQSDIKNYMSSVYISRNNNHDNIWYGISVDSGIITNIYESKYMLDMQNNQVEYDNYITEGYERNRILNPYLINLEFMFNDLTSDQFTMNQYVGFYVYNHEIKDGIFKKSTVNNLSKNRIFNITINTLDNKNNSNFYRFKNFDELEEIKNKCNNLPHENLLNCQVNEAGKVYSSSQFLTITINEPIMIGEHLRIINENESKNSTDFLGDIYEVISSKYYSATTSSIKSKDNKFGYTYGTFIGYDSYNDINKDELIKLQVKQIVKLFNSINNLPFKISSYSDNTISFSSLDIANNLVFERITNEIIYDTESNIIYEDSTDNVITYFNNFKVPSSIIKIESDYIGNTILYTPVNFEIWNNRKVFIVDFINYTFGNNSNSGYGYLYSIDKKYIIDKLDKKCITHGNNGYIDLLKFSIRYRSISYKNNNDISVSDNPPLDDVNIIISPYNSDEYIFYTEYKIKTYNNTVKIYSTAELKYNIAGISPIKDLSFNVLYNRKINGINKLNTNNQYLTTFNDIDTITLNCPYNKDIKLDKNTLYKVLSGCVKMLDNKQISVGGYIPFGTEQIVANTQNTKIIQYNNISEYFSIENVIDYNQSLEEFNDYKNNNIPLITPTKCKWCINGTDVFGNKIKELYNDDIDVLYKNVNLLGYSSFKYINDNPLYVYNSPNDIIIINDKNYTLNDALINNLLPLYSIFKNDQTLNNKFSTLYYNSTNNSLDTIFMGKFISMSFLKFNNIFKYNGYMFSIINCFNTNKSKNNVEILINDDDKICLVINHKNIGSGLYSTLNNYAIDNIYNENEIEPNNELPFIKINSDVILTESFNGCIPISKKIQCDSSVDIFLSAISNNSENIYNIDSYTYEIKNIQPNDITEYYIDLSDSSITESKNNELNKESEIINKTYNDVYEYIINPNFDVLSTDNQKDLQDSDNILYIVNKSESYNNVIRFNIANETTYDDYSFYANPEFYNVFEFDNKETKEISDFIKCDLISTNTNVKEIKNINQLWINKIFNNENNDKINKNTKNDLNVDCISNYNPFLTEWDNIMRLYNKNGKGFKTLKGYNFNKDIKLFFGSVAPVIKNDYIELIKFDNNDVIIDNKKYDTANAVIEKYNIKIDISNSLLRYLKNSTLFTTNWKDDEFINIDEYIKNVLSYYYIINNKNIIKIYRHYNSEIDKFNKFIDYDENIDYEIHDNISFDVINENNHYYLIFELPHDNYQYSIKYKIFK